MRHQKLRNEPEIFYSIIVCYIRLIYVCINFGHHRLLLFILICSGFFSSDALLTYPPGIALLTPNITRPTPVRGPAQ